jgi:hypothetical protein
MSEKGFIGVGMLEARVADGGKYRPVALKKAYPGPKGPVLFCRQRTLELVAKSVSSSL